jgi:hypothetical protein
MLGHLCYLLVVICDLYFERIALVPHTANAPLFIAANCILSCAIGFQFLETIPRRGAKILKRLHIVEHSELSQSDALDIPRELFRVDTPIDLLKYHHP